VGGRVLAHHALQEPADPGHGGERVLLLGQELHQLLLQGCAGLLFTLLLLLLLYPIVVFSNKYITYVQYRHIMNIGQRGISCIFYTTPENIKTDMES
jgi:hypothetical protein